MTYYNYEWYTIEVIESTGQTTWLIKAKDHDKAVEQINRIAKKQNKDADNKCLPAWERCGYVKNILWETMRLYRTGHNR